MLLETARQRAGDYLVRVATTIPTRRDGDLLPVAGPDDLRPPMVNRWRDIWTIRTGDDDAVFGPWHELMPVARQRITPAGRGAVAERWTTSS